MDSVKNRIREFAKVEGITVAELERRSGMSRGYVVAMRKGLGRTKLDSLLEAFPSLNREWLLYGEGTMLKAVEPSLEEEVERERRAYEVLAKGGNGSTARLNTDEYVLVEVQDLRAAAGGVGKVVIADYPTEKTLLMPKRYVDSGYIPVTITGDSMDDGSARALLDGDVVLARQVYRDELLNGLAIKKYSYIIAFDDSAVAKQILKINKQEGTLQLHSLNPEYKDYTVHLQDVQQIYEIQTLLRRDIRL